MKKFILLLIPAVLIFLVCAKAEKSSQPGHNHPNAPGFTLMDIYGNELSLSDYRGKAIFLNFWATWCPPCREEIPGFIEVYDKYKDKGMEIIGVSLDRKGPKVVRKFAKKYKINYPLVMGTPELIKDYRPGRAVPITIIIDKKNKIRHRHLGFLDKKTLEIYFLKLMEEK